jgi:hypothetical protein
MKEAHMTQQDTSGEEDGTRLLVGLFLEEGRAEAAVSRLIEADFPMDMISILGKAQSSGDDPLGLYYANAGERVKGWGKIGAFWGGLWGLLTGAAGMFLIPGVGPVMAAGPVVEALAGALTGAGVAGGAMAGAAAVSHLIVAMRRSGVPEKDLEALHAALEDGEYVVMLRLDGREVERWQSVLTRAGARTIMVCPFHGLADIV